jgi:hypothetical protein
MPSLGGGIIPQTLQSLRRNSVDGRVSTSRASYALSYESANIRARFDVERSIDTRLLLMLRVVMRATFEWICQS